MPRESLHIKLPAELVARLRKAAATKDPMKPAPTVTAILERGAVLALDELKARKVTR